MLEFLGSFASVQTDIDWATRLILKRRLPILGPSLFDAYAKRPRDAQRLVVFLDLAAETGYTGDLSNFRQVFNRAKQTRDYFAHSLNIAGPVVSMNAQPKIVAASTMPLTKLPLVPQPLYPSTMRRLTTDARWLSLHVTHAVVQAGLTRLLDLNGDEVDLGDPPPTAPQDGEALRG